MTTILSALTLHNLTCAAVGAALYAILSALLHRLARRIFRLVRRHYRASSRCRRREELLRQQGRDRLKRILAETRDPWAAPGRR